MEFYVEEDISAVDAQQLIKTEPSKGLRDVKNEGEDYQAYENDRQSSTDPFASYFYPHQVRSFIWN